MLAVVIEWCGILSAFLILLRAVRGRIFPKYVYFYSYVISVLIGTPILSLVRIVYPQWHSTYYWSIQFGTLIFGYGVILEIFTHVLSPYQGAERFARFFGIALFAAIFCFAFVYPLITTASSHADTVIELERDLRAVQAILLVGALAVISRYGIPVGQNMKGMILGYGLYIGTSLVSLAVRSYAGPWLIAVWLYAQPISFAISLLIWLVALWTYAPNPVPRSDIHLEADYEALIARTRNTVSAMRSHLARAARP